MFQSKFHNFLVVVGIVLLFTGISSSLTGLQQVTSYLQEEHFYSVNSPVEVQDFQSISPAYLLNSRNQSVDTTAANVDLDYEIEVPETPLINEADSKQPSASFTQEDTGQQLFNLSPGDPERITIPAINLDAPVVQAEIQWVQVGGGEYKQWHVPNLFAAGWHESSARLGEVGNTVFNGHNNIFGEVFRHLDELGVGDFIQVYSNTHVFEYVITNTMILPERFQEIDLRMSNAQWILPSEDYRLTLISCWPYESNTHRVIVVAKLLSVETQSRDFETKNLPIQ
jgi:LPXTG-site transpeptidase (sortase) family protein